jgi:hypothetical protein
MADSEYVSIYDTQRHLVRSRKSVSPSAFSNGFSSTLAIFGWPWFLSSMKADCMYVYPRYCSDILDSVEGGPITHAQNGLVVQSNNQDAGFVRAIFDFPSSMKGPYGMHAYFVVSFWYNY